LVPDRDEFPDAAVSSSAESQLDNDHLAVEREKDPSAAVNSS